MRKKSVVDCMIPFIDRMRGHVVENEEDAPLVFTLTNCIKHEEEKELWFQFIGEGINEKLKEKELNIEAEMWTAALEDPAELIGTLPLSIIDSGEEEMHLVSQVLTGSDKSDYDWAVTAEVKVDGKYIAHLAVKELPVPPEQGE